MFEDMFNRDYANNCGGRCAISGESTALPKDVKLYVCGFPCPPWSNRKHGRQTNITSKPKLSLSSKRVTLTHLGLVPSVAGNRRFEDDKAQVFFEMLRRRPLMAQMSMLLQCAWMLVIHTCKHM